MGAALTKCFGSITDDPKKMEMLISKCFGMFDKDKSGFVEGPEAKACAQRVLTMARVTNVPPSAIDSVFNKVAGPDQKLDKAEFTALVNQLLARGGAAQAPVTQDAAAPPAPAVAPVAAAPVAAAVPQ